MNYLLSDIATITSGRLRGFDHRCTSVSFDSRTLSFGEGVVFVALKGDRIDGHTFIGELYGRGVRSFIVRRGFCESLATNEMADCGFVEVLDPLLSLQVLAGHHRSQFKSNVVAICGSNGKSVIKEMVAQLFEGCGTFFRSPKSYNSQIGVPLSLLMAEGNEDLILIEAGISKCGEMERLQTIIKPQTVLFTNIGAAHGENFSSLEQKIEQKLLLAHNAERIIYRLSSPEAQIIEAKFSDKQLIGVDCRNSDFSLPFSDNVSGENIALAVALLRCEGYDNIDFATKVSQLHRTPMRLELHSGDNNCEIINDSYNSDYGSLEVALNYLQTIAQGRDKVVVLSDIYQSGEQPQRLYGKVAKLLKSCGISHFIAIGEGLCSAKKSFDLPFQQFYLSTSDFLYNLKTFHFDSSIILLKGSRVFGFERIMAQLESKLHNNTMEVNLDSMVHNLDFYRSKISPSTKLMAMVKAHGYGTGSFEVARALESAHVDFFAVACADEGIELREGAIKSPIVVLGSDPSSYSSMINYRLEPEIYSFKSLIEFEAHCEREHIENYPIHIKLDSGMSRLGFGKGDIPRLLSHLQRSKVVVVRSIFSHLAASDNPDFRDFTNEQISRFNTLSSTLCDGLPYKIIRHICNSAAITAFPESHFDMVRLGIGLYGFGNSNLERVVTLRSTITQIRSLQSGDFVGYSLNEQVARESKIAIVAIGYADGLRRALSCRKWNVSINGALAPIVGNICMDCCMVDVTDIVASEGDEVIIFGENPTATAMAQALGTIEYEILTDISPRVKRTYFKN